jgi:hypothetical protein
MNRFSDNKFAESASHFMGIIWSVAVYLLAMTGIFRPCALTNDRKKKGALYSLASRCLLNASIAPSKVVV